MTEEKAVKRQKPLSVAELMAGLGEGLIDAKGETVFTVTKDTFARYQAQVVWIRSQLDSWLQALKKEAGVTVISTNIKVGTDYSKYESSGVKDANVILKLSIPGRLLDEKIKNPKMRGLISGGFKKILAQSIINDFSPSFDIMNPKFAAGVLDIIKFHTTGGQLGWREKEIKKMRKKWEDTIQPGITSILVHKATLKDTFYPSSTIDGPIRIHFEYLNEATRKDREELVERLGRFLAEQEIDCHYFE